MHDTPLKLPNMVCHVLFECQGWSPDPILTNCSFSLFWPELPNCLDLNSMMDGFTIEIYINLIEKKGKRMLDQSFKQSLLWAQVSQLTFYIYLLWLATTPYCP